METPFDNMKRLDEEWEQSFDRMIVNCARLGKTPPDPAEQHKLLAIYAKQKFGFSDKGASAWASLKVEELRRFFAGWLDVEASKLKPGDSVG